MSGIQHNEIVPGLVVHCSPEALRAAGGCYVKLSLEQKRGMSITSSLLKFFDKQRCLATPLYSEKNDIRDRILLDEEQKTGKPEEWKSIASYFYKWQFWCITFGALDAASARDDSLGCRRFYGKRQSGRFGARYEGLIPRCAERDSWSLPDAWLI